MTPTSGWTSNDSIATGIAALIRAGEVDVKTLAGLGLAGWSTASDG